MGSWLSYFSGRNDSNEPSYPFDYARYMCIRVDSVQERDDTFWKEMLEQIVKVCCTVNYCNYRLCVHVYYCTIFIISILSMHNHAGINKL